MASRIYVGEDDGSYVREDDVEFVGEDDLGFVREDDASFEGTKSAHRPKDHWDLKDKVPDVGEGDALYVGGGDGSSTDIKMASRIYVGEGDASFEGTKSALRPKDHWDLKDKVPDVISCHVTLSLVSDPHQPPPLPIGRL